jgi:hypothetical protein
MAPRNISKQRFWKKHFRAIATSGLTQRQYCEQHGLSFAQLGYWRRRIDDDRPAPDDAPMFVPMEVTSHERPVQIVFPNGTMIECLPSIDLQWMSGLMSEARRS